MNDSFYSEITDYLKITYPDQDILDKQKFLVEYYQKLLLRSKQRATGKYIFIFLLLIFIILYFFLRNIFILTSAILILLITIILLFQNRLILKEFDKMHVKLDLRTYYIIAQKDSYLNSGKFLNFILIAETLLIIGLFYNYFTLLICGIVSVFVTKFILRYYINSEYKKEFNKFILYIKNK
jgi:hypothetical protein